MGSAAIEEGVLRHPARHGWLGVGLLAAVLAALAAATIVNVPAAERSLAPARPSPLSATTGAVLPSPGSPPLVFARSGGDVVARGPGFRFTFEPERVLLGLAGEAGATTVALELVSARPDASLDVAGPAGTVNDLTAGGAGTTQGFTQVVYEELWPGIDMVFTGEDGTLKYAFHVAPGASVSDIQLAYRGVQGATLSGGALVLDTRLGPLTDTRPVSFQGTATIESRFVLRQVGDGVARYGFALAGRDPSRALVIDPGVVYATLLTGRGPEYTQAIEVGPGGGIYLTGMTWSSDFPVTPGALDDTYNGFDDAFVTKLDPTGSTVLYSTFLGGDRMDNGNALAIGADGSVYLAGMTVSSDFPTTPGALRTSVADQGSGFVVRLHPSGSHILYSTYLSGSTRTNAKDIALDGSGNAYVSGFTDDPDFPTTPGAYDVTFDDTLGDSPEVFVAKVNPGGTGLVYSTFLGGPNDDFAQRIVVNPAGEAHVLGSTRSVAFPKTSGAYDTTPSFPTLGPPDDIFVAKLNAAGSDLVYSTLLGGYQDQPFELALTAGGGALVSGHTLSPTFPTTPGADQTHGGGYDGFVTELDPSGASLVFSTFVGGSGQDTAIAKVNGAGVVYAAGSTTSTDFPVTSDAAQASLGGAEDAFVARLDGLGATEYASYLGDARRESVMSFAVDDAGVMYVVGDILPAPVVPRPTSVSAAAAYEDAYVRTFVGACTIEGTAAAETLTGTPARDVICGGGGADTVLAGAGNDVVFLGPEGGTVRGGPGADALIGGAGFDRLIGDDGRDLIDGRGLSDSLSGGTGDDFVLGREGNDTIVGGDGNDRLLAGAGADSVGGGNGADLLRGGDGNDGLNGFNGVDFLYGERGNDRLNGGASRDRCFGGPGRNQLRAC